MNEEKQYLKRKKNDGLKLISALVPIEWLEDKEKIGLSWRQLIANGMRFFTEKRELENELNHFLDKAAALRAQNERINANLQRLVVRVAEIEKKSIEEVRKEVLN